MRNRPRRNAVAVTLLILAAIHLSFPQQKEEEGYKSINGAEIYYKTMGDGIPVVVVHGGPGMDHSYLLPQTARLGNGFRLIFYDQRATGKSSAEVDTNSMTMENFVEDLEGIRRAFSLKKMNLLGHSWGGLVCMFYAVKYPNHLQSLALVNSTPASAALRDSSFAIMQRKTTAQDSLAQARLISTEAFKRRDPGAMVEFLRFLFRGTFYNRQYADSLSLEFDSTYQTKSKLQRYLSKDKTLEGYDIYDRLDTVNCPTLVVGADFDILPSIANERIHDHIKKSQYVVLKDCGHFPYIEAGNIFFPLVREFFESANK